MRIYVFDRNSWTVAAFSAIFCVRGPKHDFVAWFKNLEEIWKEKIARAKNVQNGPGPLETDFLEIDP